MWVVGAGAGADGCLRALEEQLRSTGELAAKQRGEIDALRAHCDKLHAVCITSLIFTMSPLFIYLFTCYVYRVEFHVC